MPTVEDYFDDDTDIPLPSTSSRHLPSTGLRGALLEEITSDDEFDMGTLAEQGRGEYGADSKAPPPRPAGAGDKGKLVVRDDDLRPTSSAPGIPNVNPNTPMGGFMGDMMKFQEAEEQRMAKLQKQFSGANIAGDPGTYKSWNTVYPLYFDAKASVADGRRVPRKSALWWPQATHIASACASLGLPSVLEPEKTHPADWENPGRVKVQITKEGKFVNPIIKNRSQLYAQLARQMQMKNPTLVPQPEVKPVPSSPKKGDKPKAKGKTSKGKEKGTTVVPLRLPTRPPQPPRPYPALDDRLPLHTPLASAGVAVEAVKRDLEAEKEQKKNALLAPSEEGAKEKQPKIKRMVVRGRR